MASSAPFSVSYAPQSSLFSTQKPHPLAQTTSLFPPQIAQKLLCRPLRHDGFSPKRSVGHVKATLNWEKGYKNIEVFTKEHLAVSLAYDVAQLSNKYTKERGAFTVVLSGGSVVKYLRKLVEAQYTGSIDWSKWHVFWVDERVVPKDDLESNYKVANDGFLSKVQIPPANIHPIDDALQAEGAAENYGSTVRQLVQSNVIASSDRGLPKFDLMLLGMGPDGEVASLFPKHPVLEEKEKWVTVIKDSPKPPTERITFTLPVINSSSNVAVVVAGAGKASAVYSALEDDQKTDVLPVELVSPEGELTWYLEKGAASKLFKEQIHVFC